MALSGYSIRPRPYTSAAGEKSELNQSKKCLLRVVGEQVLMYGELNTVFTQIEALLDSRLLSPLGLDTNNLSALTPRHFLVHEPLFSLLQPDFTLTPVNRLLRWQLAVRKPIFLQPLALRIPQYQQQLSKWTNNNPVIPVKIS